MFSITRQDLATIYLIGENPDEQGAGRIYRAGEEEIRTIRTLMRGGVGVVELQRVGGAVDRVPDMINVAAIGYLERYAVDVRGNARVELWQAPGIGTCYIGDPDRPGRYWLIREASSPDHRFAGDAAALVDGEFLELSNTDCFIAVSDATRIEKPLIKVAEWRYTSGRVHVLVPVTDLVETVVDYIGTDLLEAVRLPEPADA